MRLTSFDDAQPLSVPVAGVLLAKLLALLVAFKKFIVLGAVVAAGAIGKVLFGRKDQSAPTST